MTEETKYFCGMCLKNTVGYFTEYCAECVTPVRDPLNGRYYPKHWFDWLEKEKVRNHVNREELIKTVDFEKVLEEFYAAHPEWRGQGAAGGGSVAKEAILLRSDGPVDVPGRVKIPAGMTIGEFTGKQAQHWWDKNVDFQKRAAGDVDSGFDGIEP